MMNSLTTAVVAVPSTLLVMAAMTGATAQVTHADPMAIRRSVYVTGGALIVAATVTGDPKIVLATGLAIFATGYLLGVVFATKVL